MSRYAPIILSSLIENVAHEYQRKGSACIFTNAISRLIQVRDHDWLKCRIYLLWQAIFTNKHFYSFQSARIVPAITVTRKSNSFAAGMICWYIASPAI